MDRSGNNTTSPPSTLQVAEDIIPVGELKAHLSEKIRALALERRLRIPQGRHS
jgi:hypothetical protein